jgi:hypothetical protein
LNFTVHYGGFIAGFRMGIVGFLFLNLEF